MKRIKPSECLSSADLDAVSEAVAPLEPAPIVPPGGAPFRCGKILYLDSKDWQAHCAKRERSFRGCDCRAFKLPASAQAVTQSALPLGNVVLLGGSGA